jgi:arsenate reductase (thioredoxin)
MDIENGSQAVRGPAAVDRTPVRVLFICTHNSARSQMAEGLLRARGGDRFAAFSAGTEATEVRPLAIRAMDELGIDIRDQWSKTLAGYLAEPFDLVVTVCDSAREACPVFPGARRTEHWTFDDPSAATGSDEERLAVFRRVRDEIADRVDRLVADARG